MWYDTERVLGYWGQVSLGLLRSLGLVACLSTVSSLRSELLEHSHANVSRKNGGGGAHRHPEGAGGLARVSCWDSLAHPGVRKVTFGGRSQPH